MGGMDVELLVVPDCPHQVAAEDLLRTALVDVGLPADFHVVTISDEAEAGFAGSPTFRANGADLFPTFGNPAGLSCRIYRSGSGPSGLPDLPALRRALKRAADTGPHRRPLSIPSLPRPGRRLALHGADLTAGSGSTRSTGPGRVVLRLPASVAVAALSPPDQRAVGGLGPRRRPCGSVWSRTSCSCSRVHGGSGSSPRDSQRRTTGGVTLHTAAAWRTEVTSSGRLTTRTLAAVTSSPSHRFPLNALVTKLFTYASRGPLLQEFRTL